MFTRQKCEKHETQQLISRRKRKRRFFLDEIDEVFDIEQDVVERNDDIPCPLNDYGNKTSKKLGLASSYSIKHPSEKVQGSRKKI